MHFHTIKTSTKISVEIGLVLICGAAIFIVNAAALLSDKSINDFAFTATIALTVIVLTAFRQAMRKGDEFVVGVNESFAEEELMIEQARHSRRQLEELFAMTDMLQSANGYDDAGTVLSTTAQRLLPEFSGALYVFNNSRDRLDLVKFWQADEQFDPAETLLPSSCWALKRGKPHINDCVSHTLECSHHRPSASSVEVPMMARGSLYGLLMLGYHGDDAFETLLDVRRMARALADSMSLALSNIALNEKLKTQSLRDPLTGLYNRRYMEDALERAVRSAERSDSVTSVVMIDLDNFKRLNDENGHAKGDAVLRDVAQYLVGKLRPSDVVSRYGGEELFLILPDTALDDAVAKSNLLCAGIARLSDAHEVPISASFGVAAYPGSVTDYRQLMSEADKALYEAKSAGKNCVKAADGGTLSGKADFHPKLVAAGSDKTR